jgi:HAE1 family hydrophobic/amphiphilic exporter-1
VVGGLITSTLLTLIVVPVVYSILDDLGAWLLGDRRRAKVAAASLMVMVVAGAAAGTASAQAPLDEAIAVQAQQAAKTGLQADGVRVLTLEEALTIAAAQNRDIQKALEYQKWVQGKYLEQRAAALPQGSLAVSFVRNVDTSEQDFFNAFDVSLGPSFGSAGASIGQIFSGRQDVLTAQAKVTQVVFTWGQVGAAIRAAKLGFGVADQQLRRFRQAVTKDVTTAFCDVLVARELARIAEEDLAQKQRHLDETTKRQLAGTATDYDVLAAQVAADNARPSVIRAENAVRSARQALGFVLAERGEVDATGTLVVPVEPVPTYETVLARAIANRPELGETVQTRGVYGELVTIAKANNKPRVDFSAAWGKRRIDLPSMGSSGSVWDAGLFASVPLFDGWRTKGLVAQAESDLMRLTFDELKLRDSFALEVRTALDAVREASEIVTALAGTVTQAERLLFLAEKGFELGVKTRLEVQDAELNLATARANLARAQRDYRVARVNLDWVSGTLDGGNPVPTK